MSACTHDLSERETACADGMCPICLQRELAEAKAALKALDNDFTERTEALIRAEAENAALSTSRKRWEEAAANAQSRQEKAEAENALMRDAINDALPWMIKLGDYIGNGTQADPMGRCNAITKMRIAVEKRND